MLLTTTEVDPIPIPYEFDGEVVTSRTDSSFDMYGGEVGQQVCNGVRRADRHLGGVARSSSSGDRFRADTLPGGT